MSSGSYCSFFVISKSGGLIFHRIYDNNNNNNNSQQAANNNNVNNQSNQNVVAITGQTALMNEQNKGTATSLTTQPTHLLLNENEYLRIASTFHSLTTIAENGFKNHINPSFQYDTNSTSSSNNQKSQNRPIESIIKPFNGIQKIETNLFALWCKTTMTGVKFLLTTKPDMNTDVIDKLFKQIYLIYSDYVMKNPFYEIEMPIKIEVFDKKIEESIRHHFR